MNDNAKLYRFLRPIINVLFKLVFKPAYEGLENIPIDGRVILAGTHTNLLDCLFLISSTKRSIHFLAKNELWQGPKKIIFSNMGLIPVNRKAKDHNALKMAIEYLNDNKLIGIFPEGTTEKKRGMLPFKMGVIKMAKETNSKIIPFAITGSYRLFSRNLKIEFGQPLQISSDDFENEKQILEKTVSNLLRGES